VLAGGYARRVEDTVAIHVATVEEVLTQMQLSLRDLWRHDRRLARWPTYLRSLYAARDEQRREDAAAIRGKNRPRARAGGIRADPRGTAVGASHRCRSPSGAEASI